MVMKYMVQKNGLALDLKLINEEKDNEIKNITEKYETTIKKLRTELDDSSQQIQILMDEKVNLTFCISILLS